jgi:protocatechuate 3,4-dioxygenase beta subunit
MHITRRSLIVGSAAAVGSAAWPAFGWSQARPTVPMVLGPYYPVVRPLESDADLTWVSSSRTRAKGEIINLVGRVLDRSGRPLVDAKVELWQANAAGRYGHPDERNPAPLDPGFQGSAVLKTDQHGAYRVKTVRPGSYDGGTPHIHFDVTAATQRLVTQMIFPEEPLNEIDGLIRGMSAGARASVTARSIAALKDAPGETAFAWDIVLF